MRARHARQIRRRPQQNSQCPNHCGVSELWLAPPEDALTILQTLDERLKFWLLGFTDLPATLLEKFRTIGLSWSV